VASIFTKVINREIPGHFVWEDDLCISIMTIQPIRQGHLLVIPKAEVNHWDDMPEALLAATAAIIREVLVAEGHQQANISAS
jgi:diadenosine tetraphosphate (Ap4A) HIT family hydrolase